MRFCQDPADDGKDVFDAGGVESLPVIHIGDARPQDAGLGKLRLLPESKDENLVGVLQKHSGALKIYGPCREPDARRCDA